MIKQFQRDYMKVPETGKICGNVLKAIDEFQTKYPINFEQIKCKCGKCNGFGNSKYLEQKQNTSIAELYRKYEYPGIHRSLVWALRALNFYMVKTNLGYSLNCISSGYRCWIDNDSQSPKRKSTNHMGKAIDLHFNKSGTRTQQITDMEAIRDKIIIPYMGGQLRWGNPNKFSLEPTRISYKGEFIATTWIHYDVRQFELKYLKDEYFVTSISTVNGKSIITLSKELGFTNTCNCLGTTNTQKKEEEKIKDDRVDPKTLKATEKVRDFIKSYESFFSKPYNDSEGYATIGIGYLVAYKKVSEVTQSDVSKTEITWKEFIEGISKERALELFNKKIILYENSIYRDVKVPLYQYEFDALVSLLFNCGPDYLRLNKAPKLYKNLINKNYEVAAHEFLDITNKGTPGLIKRRKNENKMFLYNIYENNK